MKNKGLSGFDSVNVGECFKVALAGNPNVGKSTLFNRLTGMKRHTGNWTGKTVDIAFAECRHKGKKIILADLPGTYSLNARSEEERVAREYVESGESDMIAVVCDATCLERNLILALQILELSSNVIVCVNLLDEAKKKGIDIDLDVLSKRLQVPVIGICARNGKGVDKLLDCIIEYREHEHSPVTPKVDESIPTLAAKIAKDVTTAVKDNADRRDRGIDKIVTGRIWGFPIMLLLLAFIFWLTIEGANVPSRMLAKGFSYIEGILLSFFGWICAPSWLVGVLVFGIYRTVSWVVSVMLPPMLIFFPLFTLLEDFGYLPRIAFNLDRCFRKCNACGKQALTM